ncbi:MAG TPA: lysophospholipid acyltransferase family protein [Myxococcota bacterium]|nr:lysophospholipid acyltransferase family protein [Myxococcota bacterium]HRY93853.1 lysophospholipid acyltransferase family protein [Myxococcota bacterium]
MAAFLVWLVAWLLVRSLRLRVHGLEQIERLHAAGRPILYCFWHGRQLALFRVNPERPPRPPLVVLTSRSRDGEVQARVCRRFGLRVVRGSSSRGGLAGLLALSRASRAGHALGVAVDGPRGPAGQAKPGALALARATGAALVPLGAGYRHRLELARAWDRFQIPPPFGRVEVLFGVPIELAPDADLEAAAARLGQALGALSDEADARARGRPLV